MNIPPCLNNILHLTFQQATSSKSLVDRGKFWQNGPASQHVRKEPTYNKFLVDFCFALTAWCLLSSDLPLSPKSLFFTRKALPIPPRKNSLSLKKNPHSPFLQASPPSSKSLVDKGRFWQNGPASQHIRKEPTKN
jgi:hypothetical protein